MLGVSFTSPMTVMVAIDREQFTFHIVKDTTSKEAKLLGKWVVEKDSRKKVALVSGLRTAVSFKPALKELHSVLVFDQVDVLRESKIRCLDSDEVGNGLWKKVRMDPKSLNEAILHDDTSLVTTVKLPSFLTVLDDLPEDISLVTVLDALRKQVDYRDIKSSLPDMAGYLGGVVTRTQYRKAKKALIEVGADPVLMEEFEFYTRNDGKVVKRAYELHSYFGIPISNLVGFFSGDSWENSELLDELNTVLDLSPKDARPKKKPVITAEMRTVLLPKATRGLKRKKKGEGPEPAAPGEQQPKPYLKILKIYLESIGLRLKPRSAFN